MTLVESLVTQELVAKRLGFLSQVLITQGALVVFAWLVTVT